MKARVIIAGLVLVVGACADDDAEPIFTSTTGGLAATTVAPAITSAPDTTAAPPTTAAGSALTTAPATTVAPVPTVAAPPTTGPECLVGGPPRPSPGTDHAYGDFDGDGVIDAAVYEEFVVYRVGDEWFLWLATSYGYSTEISLGFQASSGEGVYRGNMGAIASAYLGFPRELVIVRTASAPAEAAEDIGRYEFYAFEGCSLVNTGDAYNEREFPPVVGVGIQGRSSFTCHDDGTVRQWELTYPEGGGYHHRSWAFEYDPATMSWIGLGQVLDVVTANEFIDITGAGNSRVNYFAEEDIIYGCASPLLTED